MGLKRTFTWHLDYDCFISLYDISGLMRFAVPFWVELYSRYPPIITRSSENMGRGRKYS